LGCLAGIGGKEADPELAYLFKHVVIQEVAYESLPYGLRTRIHEAIGLYVEREIPAKSVEVLDLLAFHFSRSKNTPKKREYLLLAGDASREAYACASAAVYYKAVMPLLDDGEKVPVLRNLGRVLEVTGEWNEAMDTHKQALALSLEKRLDLEATNCRMDIGDLLRKMGTFDEAGNWLSKALDGYTELGHQPGIGQVLHNQGTLAAQTGNYDQARELYSQSIKIRRELGDEAKVAALVSNMGIISRFQGDLEQALKLQEEGLEIRRRLEDPFSIGNSLNNLGMAKRYLGNLDGARKDLEEALSILQRIGDRAEIANTLNSLAEVALDQQDSDACETFLLESLQLTRELGNLRALAFLFEAFAFNASNQGNSERCLKLFGASRSLRSSIGAPLPKADESKIQEKIEEIRQDHPETEVKKLMDRGASLALSAALDYAGSTGMPQEEQGPVA
jgi:tetratricopeptide (TPR) repeat protein